MSTQFTPVIPPSDEPKVVGSATSSRRPSFSTTRAVNGQSTDAGPAPADFKPKDNPAFILNGKLDTCYGTVRWGGINAADIQRPVPSVGPDEVLVEVKHTVS